MDAWAALWFWPIDGPDDAPKPPTLAHWIDALEGLLGIEPAKEPPGQMQLFDSLEELVEHEKQLALEFNRLPVEQVVEAHPWLEMIRQIADREGFFHWELEFAPVFHHGGFDLQVGNPPWVRLDWEDDVALAEHDPWFGITEKLTPKDFASRRASVLQSKEVQGSYASEMAAAAGLVEILKDTTLHPVLAKLRTNLYMAFIDATWRHLGSDGVIGLLHPGGHLVDPKGSELRRAAYARYRRCWQFINEARLFEDIHHSNEYGIHIYGQPGPVAFVMMANVQLPETVDMSFEHDGSGEVPGIKTPDGAWDRRPHALRLLSINDTVLESWARLFDDPGTPPGEARLLRPHTQAELNVIRRLAQQTVRLADYRYFWTQGFNETNAVRDGIIRWETAIPTSWDDVVFQGPHFSVSRPFAKQPNPGCKNNLDYTKWNLELLPQNAVPRTNYHRDSSRDDYKRAIDYWMGRPANSFWRQIHREYVGPGWERTYLPALIPPGPMHVHSCISIAFEDSGTTARFVGLGSSLPCDYYVKIAGGSHINDTLLRRLAFPRESPYYGPLTLRSLRLNCLTSAYAPIWEELFDGEWKKDSFTRNDARLSGLGEVTKTWTPEIPLRRDFDRRQALIEIDALAGLLLGISADELGAIYRTTFAVLRKNEHAMYFDANGRQVPRAIVKEWKKESEEADLGRSVLPFDQPDREKEMRLAYEDFSRRKAEGLL